jgi:hypothetical protein
MRAELLRGVYPRLYETSVSRVQNLERFRSRANETLAANPSVRTSSGLCARTQGEGTQQRAAAMQRPS